MATGRRAKGNTHQRPRVLRVDHGTLKAAVANDHEGALWCRCHRRRGLSQYFTHSRLAQGSPLVQRRRIISLHRLGLCAAVSGIGDQSRPFLPSQLRGGDSGDCGNVLSGGSHDFVGFPRSDKGRVEKHARGGLRILGPQGTGREGWRAGPATQRWLWHGGPLIDELAVAIVEVEEASLGPQYHELLTLTTHTGSFLWGL